MNATEIAAMMGEIAPVIREYLAAETAALRQEIAALKGQDVRSIASAVIDRENCLVLTYTDGTTQSLGVVVGKDGDDGATFTVDDFDIEQYPDGRTFKFMFTRGDVCHSFEFAFPVVLDRGVWKEGDYENGDAVSWGGSLWIAQRDTSDKPDSPDSGWRLAVKRGRDGKDAR